LLANKSHFSVCGTELLANKRHFSVCGTNCWPTKGI
jgi:hypothetical protein